MSLLRLSLSYLRRRPLTAVLNALLLALGVATIVVLLLFSRQLEDGLARDARGIDLVVGAKGSPLQLVLSAVYHTDVPTGNVPLADAETVARNPAVASAIPLALGDSYRGAPVVGTTGAYADLYGARVAEGRTFAAPFEVVLGADVAAARGLAAGATFTTSHGVSDAGPAHEATPMRVVGVLGATGTVIDRLVLTSIETVWAVHDHREGEALGGGPAAPADTAPGALPESSRVVAVAPLAVLGPQGPSGAAPSASGSPFGLAPQPAGANREITAVLLRLRNPAMGLLYARSVDDVENLKSAIPALEVNRLLDRLGLGRTVLRGIGVLLMLTATFGFFTTLYNALKERRYDLAMMRTLGASRGTLVAHVLLEGLLLAAFGLVLGLLLGHVGASVLGRALAADQGFRFTGLAWHPGEWALVAAALGVGLVAALLPAFQAYRTDIAETLAVG